MLMQCSKVVPTVSQYTTVLRKALVRVSITRNLKQSIKAVPDIRTYTINDCKPLKDRKLTELTYSLERN